MDDFNARVSLVISQNPVLSVAVIGFAVLAILLLLSSCKWKRRYRDLNDEVERDRRQGKNIINDAKEAAKNEIEKADRELNNKRSRLESILSEIENENVNHKRLVSITSQREAEAASATEKAEAAEKRLSSLANRFKKAKRYLESAIKSAECFANGGTPSYLKVAYEGLLEEFHAVIPADIKALTMKDLRAQYRQNEKAIRELCELYPKNYTTKANATIYRLVVLALEEGLQNILHTIAYGKLDAAIANLKKLTSKCFEIAIEGNQTIVPTLSRFIRQVEYLYIEAIKIEYEYYVKRERAREEQRAIREQMRQEVEERKALEQQRRKVESEEKKYQQEIERLQEMTKAAIDDEELTMLNSRLAEVELLLTQVEEKKEEIITLQNGKAGTVYIISNLGAFGDGMFKIGMTRRLEPMDRVRELGDASVPFPFDVHSLIFSEDAVSLEYALHKELSSKRVNKINLRKEFFSTSIDELEDLVNKIDPSAPFEKTMIAEQYHQSLSIDVIPDDVYIDFMEDEPEEAESAEAEEVV